MFCNVIVYPENETVTTEPRNLIPFNKEDTMIGGRCRPLVADSIAAGKRAEDAGRERIPVATL